VGTSEAFAGTVAATSAWGERSFARRMFARPWRRLASMKKSPDCRTARPRRSSPMACPSPPTQSSASPWPGPIAGKPRLLLIDGLIDGLDIHECPELVESLFDRANPWTLVIVTAREDITRRCDKTVNWS